LAAAAAGDAGAPATHHATVSATPRPGASQRRNPARHIAIMPAPLIRLPAHPASDQPRELTSESARRWSVMLEAAFIEARHSRPVNPTSSDTTLIRHDHGRCNDSLNPRCPEGRTPTIMVSWQGREVPPDDQSNSSRRTAADRWGTGSSGKNSAHTRKASAEDCTPAIPASRQRPSMSRVLAASAFMAKTCSGEAAITRNPGWPNTRRLPGSGRSCGFQVGG
jgi:hypothetical protein